MNSSQQLTVNIAPSTTDLDSSITEQQFAGSSHGFFFFFFLFRLVVCVFYPYSGIWIYVISHLYSSVQQPIKRNGWPGSCLPRWTSVCLVLQKLTLNITHKLWKLVLSYLTSFQVTLASTILLRLRIPRSAESKTCWVHFLTHQS